MKVRHGFVTNSSSSSFILCFQSKDNILDELVKENLTAEELGLLVQSITGGTGMTREQVQEYVALELLGDIEYLRWNDNRQKGVPSDWDAPLEGEWKAEHERRVKAVMNHIPTDVYAVQIEESDNSMPGSVLEHEILPRLSVTKATFSHH